MILFYFGIIPFFRLSHKWATYMCLILLRLHNYRRPRTVGSMREGNVLTGVCDFVQEGGGAWVRPVRGVPVQEGGVGGTLTKWPYLPPPS